MADLARRDVRVWRDGERLRCSGPTRVVTPELRQQLTTRKAELLAFFAADPEPALSEPIARVIEGPIAWKGAELTPDAGVVRLSQGCHEELETVRARLRDERVPRESVRPDDFELPDCRAAMERAREQLDQGHGFAVIDRLDVGRMPEDEARSLYWLLASMLARPVPLKWDGTRMRDVTDLGKRSPRAVDTTADMNYHTDNSYNPCPPDYVSLLCLQKAKEGGVSRLVSFASVHNELRARHPDLLARLYAAYVFNRQGEHAPGEESTLRRPIFESHEGVIAARMSHFHVRTGQALVGEPLTPRAEQALEALEAIMNEPGMSHDFGFEPGQIQILDNRRIGHKRTAFRDWPEPARKRRLVRLWLRDGGRPGYNG